MGTHVGYDQHLLDLAFSDLDFLLQPDRPVVGGAHGACVACFGNRLSYAGSGTSHPGSLVCDNCGVVQPGCVFYETMYGRDVARTSSNYKRIHHWHERISQLLLLETPIADDEMLLIAAKLLDGTHAVACKDTIRAILRSLNLQLYIEKWLQIIFRCTNIAPPVPGSGLIQKLDEMFSLLQEPFNCFRTDGRKNFLNYNYVFCRLFQLLDCTQFCMFFPLIKSKQKLKQLDDTWLQMATSLKWEVKPLVQVAPFAVKIERPDLSMQNLRSQCERSALAELHTELPIAVSRTLDRRSTKRLITPREPYRSGPLELEPQKSESAKKQSRRVSAKRPRLLNPRANRSTYAKAQSG